MIQNFPYGTTVAGGYILRLGNGQGWQIIASEGTRALVDKLASIMELKKDDRNGYPRLIFIHGEKDTGRRGEPLCYLDPKIQEDLPWSGRKAYNFFAIQIWSHWEMPDLICEIRHEESDYELGILALRLSLYPIYQRVQDSGGLPLHAALAEWNGLGVLLVAPGGAGKSTCASRLVPPWSALCDEETLVVMNDQKKYLAHPFPTWSDHFTGRSNRTWDVQRFSPLAAIFFLEQAEIEEAFPIGQGQTAVLINQAAMQVCHRYWGGIDPEEKRARKEKLFENACEIARKVPAFKLRVSLEGRFWEKIESVLL